MRIPNHSEIKKYRNYKHLKEDIDFNNDSYNPSDISTSQLKDLVYTVIQNSQNEISNNNSTSSIESKSSDSSSESLDDIVTKDSSASTSYSPSTISKTHKYSPLKKSNIRSHSRGKRPSRPFFSRLEYTELEPINLYSKTKFDLIPLTTNRILSFLKLYDGEICFISPVSKSPQVTPDGNMWRCLSFVESLKKNDFLYFPVYLYDYPSEQILDIVFLVYVFPVNHPNLNRQFQDLFNLITFISKRYSIHNLVYRKDNKYVIKQGKNYSYLELNTYEDVIKHLCSLNQNTVDEDKVIMTNPLCSTKMEYLNRHISGNELCTIS